MTSWHRTLPSSPGHAYRLAGQTNVICSDRRRLRWLAASAFPIATVAGWQTFERHTEVVQSPEFPEGNC